MRLIQRIAGILTAASGVLGILLAFEELSAGQLIAMLLITALGIGIFVAAPYLKVTAVVTDDTVKISCSGFRASICLADIAAVDASNFPTLGYGYRHLGRNHRGFIAGGPQVRVLLHSGKQYEVSVDSVEDFRAAVGAATDRINRR